MQKEIKQIVLCHHCNNITPRKLVFTHRCPDFGFYETGEKIDFTYYVKYYITEFAPKSCIFSLSLLISSFIVYLTRLLILEKKLFRWGILFINQYGLYKSGMQ